MLAGGYDYSILGWDLDAEIDKPLFHLVGHSSPVVRVVGMGALDRCVSLDVNGEMRYWDVNKGNSIDREERQIDVVTLTEDRMRTLDLFQHVQTHYKGVVLCSYGRRQHVYCIKDTTPVESAPVSILFIKDLLLIISVHTRNVVQWNVINGKEIKRIKDVCAPSSELTACVLGDRKRKFILGDSSGRVGVYSCLSGQQIRQLPTLPFSVRFLIYSQDQNVIAVAGQGDIHVLDATATEDDDKKYALRDVRGHDVDIVCMAYSRVLGLIATADCVGVIMVWNYLYLSLEIMVEGLVDTEVGHMAFIEPYPLLLIPDARGNFTILAVGPTTASIGRRVWRVETQVPRYPLNMYLDQSATAFTSVWGRTARPQTAPTYVEEDGTEVSYFDEDDEKAPETTESKLKPFGYHRKCEYLLGRRTVKHIIVHFEPLSKTEDGGMQDTAPGSPKPKDQAVSAAASGTVVSTSASADVYKPGEQTDSVTIGATATASVNTDKSTPVSDPEAASASASAAVAAALMPISSHFVPPAVELDDENSVQPGFQYDDASLDALSVDSDNQDLRSEGQLSIDVERHPGETNYFFDPNPGPISPQDFEDEPEGSDDEAFSGCRSRSRTQSQSYGRKRTNTGTGTNIGGPFSPGNSRRNSGLGSPISDDDYVFGESPKPKKVSYRPFHRDKRVLVYCGMDDGSTSVTDLTHALIKINLRALEESEFVYNQPNYNSKRKLHRSPLKDSDFARASWSTQDILNGEKFAKGTLELVWNAHKAATVSMEFVGDYYDLLTGTEDGCVQTWTGAGVQRGVLTRGREWDNVFPPRWASPIDLELRANLRLQEAQLHNQRLSLKTFFGNNERYLQRQYAKYPYFAPKTAQSKRRGLLASPMHGGSHSHSHSRSHTPHTPHSGGLEGGFSSSVATNSIPNLGGFTPGTAHFRTLGSLTMSDRERVLLQLAGEVTYELSNKDIANSKLAHKHQTAMASISMIGREGGEIKGSNSKGGTKGKRRKRRSGSKQLGDDVSLGSTDSRISAAEKERKEEALTDHRYYESVTLDTDALMADIKRDVGDRDRAAGGNGGGGRKTRSRYDIELAQIDARDPNNWEIRSANRQRALYGHLYAELDRDGLVVDCQAPDSLTSKLNSLAPDGSFRSFADSMRSIREEKSGFGSSKRRVRGNSNTDGESESASEMDDDDESGVLLDPNVFAAPLPAPQLGEGGTGAAGGGSIPAGIPYPQATAAAIGGDSAVAEEYADTDAAIGEFVAANAAIAAEVLGAEGENDQGHEISLAAEVADGDDITGIVIAPGVASVCTTVVSDEEGSVLMPAPEGGISDPKPSKEVEVAKPSLSLDLSTIGTGTGTGKANKSSKGGKEVAKTKTNAGRGGMVVSKSLPNGLGKANAKAKGGIIVGEGDSIISGLPSVVGGAQRSSGSIASISLLSAPAGLGMGMGISGASTDLTLSPQRSIDSRTHEGLRDILARPHGDSTDLCSAAAELVGISISSNAASVGRKTKLLREATRREIKSVARSFREENGKAQSQSQSQSQSHIPPLKASTSGRRQPQQHVSRMSTLGEPAKNRPESPPRSVQPPAQVVAERKAKRERERERAATGKTMGGDANMLEPNASTSSMRRGQGAGAGAELDIKKVSFVAHDDALNNSHLSEEMLHNLCKSADDEDYLNSRDWEDIGSDLSVSDLGSLTGGCNSNSNSSSNVRPAGKPLVKSDAAGAARKRVQVRRADDWRSLTKNTLSKFESSINTIESTFRKNRRKSSKMRSSGSFRRLEPLNRSAGALTGSASTGSVDTKTDAGAGAGAVVAEKTSNTNANTDSPPSPVHKHHAHIEKGREHLERAKQLQSREARAMAFKAGGAPGGGFSLLNTSLLEQHINELAREKQEHEEAEAKRVADDAAAKQLLCDTLHVDPVNVDKYAAFNSWSRKASFYMKGERGMQSEYDKEKRIRHLHREDESVGSGVDMVFDSAGHARKSGVRQKKRISDKELLQRVNFGPYEVKDLIRLWRVVASLPKVTLDKDGDRAGLVAGGDHKDGAGRGRSSSMISSEGDEYADPDEVDEDGNQLASDKPIHPGLSQPHPHPHPHPNSHPHGVLDSGSVHSLENVHLRTSSVKDLVLFVDLCRHPFMVLHPQFVHDLEEYVPRPLLSVFV